MRSSMTNWEIGKLSEDQVKWEIFLTESQLQKFQETVLEILVGDLRYLSNSSYQEGLGMSVTGLISAVRAAGYVFPETWLRFTQVRSSLPGRYAWPGAAVAFYLAGFTLRENSRGHHYVDLG